MYNCPNCSGNLSFDIASQTLMCDYCKTQLDPYEYEKTQDAEENDVYGVQVFTCPQCGGEIMTTNVTAAGFCTYCGASTILDSRMRKEKRPTHIIPFSRTKEDCQKAYASYVRRALFAPGAFRDPEYLSRFRGIYIPYWVYKYKLDGDLRMSGTKTHRRGDYRITQHYRLTGQVDASYEGIHFDASSSFDDTVAESIAPFEAAKFRPFTPSILCGFYADAPDVEASVYAKDASDTVLGDALDRLSGVGEYRKNGLEIPDAAQFRSHVGQYGLRLKGEEPVCAYLPVWFLTYRKNDRVAYAVMNGSTGKITADLPVDEKKYVFGSLLVAIPIFAALAFFLTMTGQMVLMMSSILALISLMIYSFEISAISDKDTHAGDKGFQKPGDTADAPGASRKKEIKKAAGKMGGGAQKLLGAVLPVIVFLILAGQSVLDILSGVSFSAFKIYALISAVLLIADLVIMNWAAASQTAARHMYLHTAGSILAVVAAAAILVWNPVSDLWFYGGAILAAFGVCLTFLGIIGKYNVLATRPLPTFYDRKGGNDRA
jgi:DNA-directed RNA polymerase subunit RPC12/RpoP